MSDFIFHVVILLFTFYALARVVDVFFVETLEIISKRLKLSSDIAGATFMAVGSSAPELFVSFLALFKVAESSQSIGAGTIVGSAIFNILVIIGVSALFRQALLTWQPVVRDLIFYSVIILVLLLTFMDGYITLGDALIFVGFYVVYLFSFGIWRKFFPYETKGDKDNEFDENGESEQDKVRQTELTWKNAFDKLLALVFIDLKKKPNWYLVNFVIAILLLGVLSHYMVESAVGVAHYIGVSEVIISLTILAAGTSVPDLLSSINVAKKGRGDMAIANAVGSNIFDIAIGLGLPWMIVLLFRQKQIAVATENLYSSVVLLFATVFALLFLLLMKKWEMGRYAGIFLVGAYVFYVLSQIGIIELDICFNVYGHHCFVL